MSTVSVPQEGNTPHDRRRWYALLILSLSLMLVIMDSTIVNVAIPSISEEFNASFNSVEWVNTIYSLVYAATLILWGKIGDQYGRRLMFLIGVVLFGIGSGLVGAASSIEMLIAMRALQGLGAAVLSPSTLSIITTTFKGRERGIAFGIWGATAGVAAALGPLLGGWVITNASWRWAFYINIPIVVAAFFGSLWAIREARDLTSKHHFDLVGTLLGGFGLAGIVFGIIEGQSYGWWKPERDFSVLGVTWPSDTISIVPVSIIGGLLLLLAFTWYEIRLERRGTEPLFEFGLFRFRSYRYGLLTGMIVNQGEIGVLFAATLFLQGTKGLSALDTGIALLPLAGLAFVAAPLAGSFSTRIGPKWIITAGMMIEAIMLLLLSLAITPDVSVTTIALILGFYGLGLGLTIAQLQNLVLYDIPNDKSGIASGANSTIRQVGAALGIAIIGTVLTTSTANTLRDEFQADSELAAVPFVGAMEDQLVAMAQQPIFFDFEQMFSQPGGMPMGMFGSPDSAEGMPPAAAGEPDTTAEGGPPPGVSGAPGAATAEQGRALDRAFDVARSNAMSNAALVAAIFVGIGALSSLRMPNPREAAAHR